MRPQIPYKTNVSRTPFNLSLPRYTQTHRKPAKVQPVRTMPVDAISAARLGVFIVFLPLASYCLFKHGKFGFLGWLFVTIFCVLRVITGGMGLHGDRTGTAFVILNSIGLSPLLLAAAGVSHEA